MIGSNSMSSSLLTILLLFSISNFLNTFAFLTPNLCLPDQRDVLLELKKEFHIQKPCEFLDGYLKTKSWADDSDCCSWDGITCNAKSGDVIGLDLSSSCLQGRLKSNSSLFKLQHLRDLNLAYNNFTASLIPAEFDKLQGLERLNLSDSLFSGQIPNNLLQLTNLVSLDLSSNNFTGEIPSSLGNLKKLTDFDVGVNKLSGNFPSALLNLTKLRSIKLYSNQFTGFFPPNISQLSKLEYFDASNNYFMGPIPSSLFKISSLTIIYLYNNNLNDLVGIENISLLPNLEGFCIGENNYRVRVNPIDLNVFSPFKHLESLGLSGIPLSTTNITSDSVFSSHLLKLYLSNCEITEFPKFIKHQRNLTILDLSNNKIKGQVPEWSICGLSSLSVLDIANNNLHGFIPRCLGTHMSFLSHLNLQNNYLNGIDDVSHNRLEGKLPASLTACSALEVLNVGNNRIDDAFPFWLSSLQKLQVLVLRSNKFHGMLYQSDGVWFKFPQLKIIDLSHNNFHGALPYDYFLDWNAISSKRDNYIEPNYIGNYHDNGYYISLVLMSKGVSMTMQRILKIDTAIDFSGDQLYGKIPDSIGLLKELRMLNLSNNAFTGHIPTSLANLTNLESLDLSQNKIFGEIPPQLGTLSSLEWINVSHNQLVGPIPQGTQFQRQTCSSYQGNPGLYGPSLDAVCGDIHAPTLPQPQPLETKEEEEEEWFSWVAAGLGLLPGVVFGSTMGYIVAS